MTAAAMSDTGSSGMILSGSPHHAAFVITQTAFFQAEEEASAIEEAVGDTLATSGRTPDLTPPGSRSMRCSEIARTIADRVADAS